MDESYADLRRLGEHFQTNIDVMPYFDSLQENTIRGFALSSVYGGGTANSEYEFLTGNSLAYLPAGCVAYQQYLPEDAYSMVSSLRDRGYATVAMHPYYASGWMRNKVWPQLGFSETYFLESFPQQNLVRRFVSDQEMFEKVVRRYETRDRSRPLFLFGVTMQNHGGYRYYGENYMTEVRLRGFTQAYPRAEQYLTLIHETDKALPVSDRILRACGREGRGRVLRRPSAESGSGVLRGDPRRPVRGSDGADAAVHDPVLRLGELRH